MARIIDWPTLRREYVTSRVSYADLANKYGVSHHSVEWHGRRERWRLERLRYCEKVEEKLSTKSARTAAITLAELNRQHLRRSDQMRALLERQLLTRTEDGKVVPRPDLTIAELAKATIAFSTLFRMDRLALGADSEQQPTPRHTYEAMSIEELEEELRKVRARNILH